jgi:hypothetical protein
MTLAVGCLLAGPVSAQTTRAKPDRRPASRPTLHTLDALDAEVQQLYRAASEQMVRVQVPVPVPVDDFLARFDPKVRAQLKPNAPRLFVKAPSTQALEVTPDADLIPLPTATATLIVEFNGLVLNRRGDVLLPLYVDRAYAPARMIVAVDEERATTAQVVGADRLTGLTIVRMAEPGGEVAQFSKSRPAAGALVLKLAPTRREARLGVWTGGGGGQDENAILVNREGQVAGIVRNGRALYPMTFKPVVDQLLATGAVRRATLGVQIMAVRPDDPQRAQLPALGSRSAARVVDVLADSAAARGGLQKGDLILSLAGEAIEDIPTFAAAIANKTGPTELVVLRGGERHTIVVELQVQ